MPADVITGLTTVDVEEVYRSPVTSDTREMKITYLVRGALHEDQAMEQVLYRCPMIAPPGLATSERPANRNDELRLWDIALEEVRQFDRWLDDPGDPYEQPVNAHFVTCQYRARQISPEFSVQWGTENVTVYEGVGKPLKTSFPDLSPSTTYDSYIGINLDIQNDNVSVRGTDKMFPTGRIQLKWMPETIYEFQKRSNDAWDEYVVQPGPHYWMHAFSYIGKVHGHYRTDSPNEEIYDFLDTWAGGNLLCTGFQANPVNEWLRLWEFIYTFDFRPNRKGVKIYDVTVGDVEGWDYVWAARDNTIGTTGGSGGDVKKMLLDKIKFYRVERLYERKDMNTLFCTPKYGELIVKGDQYFTAAALPQRYSDWGTHGEVTYPEDFDPTATTPFS